MAKDDDFRVEDEDEEKKDSRDDEPERKPPKPRPAPPPDDDYYRDRDRDRDGPPPPGYGPPPTPMFSAEKLPKLLAIFMLIGIIILFVGALLTSTAGFVKIDGDTAKEIENAQDLKRNLTAGGHLMGGIALFLMGLLVVIPLMVIKDLSDRQKLLLGIFLMAIILGFSLLINKTLV